MARYYPNYSQTGDAPINSHHRVENQYGQNNPRSNAPSRHQENLSGYHDDQYRPQEQQQQSFRPEYVQPQYLQVDSWRSYANGTSSLETNLNTYGHSQPHEYMDAIAPSFQPHQQYAQSAVSHFTPYQPPRVSNGVRENQVLEQQIQRWQNRNAVSSLSSPEQTHTYTLRSNRPAFPTPEADQAIPSIESGTSRWRGSRSNNTPEPSHAHRIAPSRSVTPLPVPIPTHEYVRLASLPPTLRKEPQKLLVILDLNGTLLHRPNRGKSAHINQRPGVQTFMSYLFEHHTVMIYSSARPENVELMISSLIPPLYRQLLVAVWARDKLGLSKAQYNEKVQVYKRLDHIWKDKTIQAQAPHGRKWDQSNTVLVDDSFTKAASHPWNLLKVDEFQGGLPQADRRDAVKVAEWQQNEMRVLKELEERMEKCRYAVDVSRLIRTWMRDEKGGIVDLNNKAEASNSVAPELGSDAATVELEQTQLLTPRSLDAGEFDDTMGNDKSEGKDYEPPEDIALNERDPTARGSFDTATIESTNIEDGIQIHALSINTPTQSPLNNSIPTAIPADQQQKKQMCKRQKQQRKQQKHKQIEAEQQAAAVSQARKELPKVSKLHMNQQQQQQQAQTNTHVITNTIENAIAPAQIQQPQPQTQVRVHVPGLGESYGEAGGVSVEQASIKKSNKSKTSKKSKKNKKHKEKKSESPIPDSVWSELLGGNAPA